MSNLNKQSAKKIFEKYNPASDVVRCPNGRAATRKLLDSYARAAVNLYGVISRDEFVDIFNSQNTDKTNTEELYILLLPLILKDAWYGFYKEYIVQHIFFDDFKYVDYLLSHQEGKPRYIPRNQDFLKYIDEYYEDTDHWFNVLSFMHKTFGYYAHVREGYEEIKEYITYSDEINQLGSICEEHELVFNNQKELEDFFQLIMHAKNNTRLWTNNGHTPSELSKINAENNKNVIEFPKLQQTTVGRNSPCPCGSGKKYKSCCAVFDETKSAQLSHDECILFYETWYGLLGYVNDKKAVINIKIKPEYPNMVDDMLLYQVAQVLWDNPEIINEYIHKTALSQEKKDILYQWLTKHKKGTIMIWAYKPQYAIVIFPRENGGDRLYGVKGICNSIASILLKKLPIHAETVLLPFKGKIIYDGFLSSAPLGFGEGAMKLLTEQYNNALKHGIITSLD